jgi:hypothetical protein
MFRKEGILFHADVSIQDKPKASEHELRSAFREPNRVIDHKTFENLAPFTPSMVDVQAFIALRF